MIIDNIGTTGNVSALLASAVLEEAQDHFFSPYGEAPELTFDACMSKCRSQCSHQDAESLAVSCSRKCHDSLVLTKSVSGALRRLSDLGHGFHSMAHTQNSRRLLDLHLEVGNTPLHLEKSFGNDVAGLELLAHIENHARLEAGKYDSEYDITLRNQIKASVNAIGESATIIDGHLLFEAQRRYHYKTEQDLLLPFVGADHVFASFRQQTQFSMAQLASIPDITGHGHASLQSLRDSLSNLTMMDTSAIPSLSSLVQVKAAVDSLMDQALASRVDRKAFDIFSQHLTVLQQLMSSQSTVEHADALRQARQALTSSLLHIVSAQQAILEFNSSVLAMVDQVTADASKQDVSTMLESLALTLDDETRLVGQAGSLDSTLLRNHISTSRKFQKWLSFNQH
eukprot:2699185-Rhodomonas_salina.1